MTDTFRTARIRALSGAGAGLLFVTLLMIFTSGCAGNQPLALSTTRMEAVHHNQRGIKSEASGEHRQALEEFSEAFRINSSIENSDGIIVALVNSSRVQRHIGATSAAQASINRAIPLVTTLSPLYPDVAFEMAQVKLLAGELNEASEWASRATATENGAKRGMATNLLARILYQKGDVTQAELKAREALLLNREEGMHGEEANSLRTLGHIQAAGKRYAEAAESYKLALAIDKTLGRSRKIAADLRALALLSLSQNSADQALDYFRRACAVSNADGDRSGAADDLLQMSRIHEQRGEKEQSERLLAERAALLKNPATKAPPPPP